MKISKMAQELKSLYEKYGDITIRTVSPHLGGFGVVTEVLHRSDYFDENCFGDHFEKGNFTVLEIEKPKYVADYDSETGEQISLEPANF